MDKSSENGDDSFTLFTKVQQSGILGKKFGQALKWTKRFFVVKDGFLVYYSENEKKSFDKKGIFNIHPKGVIPLGGCCIKSAHVVSHPFLIEITSEEFKWDHILLLADTPMERDRWLNALQEASRITWTNSQLGETLIRELETQGLQLSKEKQDCFEKLQIEAIALRDEIERNEELEKMTLELEKEKHKLEHMMNQMKEEHDRSRQEIEEAASTLKLLEDDKESLQKTAEMLQTTLEDLNSEKEKTLQLLHSRDEETQNLYLTTEDLHNTLEEIEEDTRLILQEKNDLEQRYLENQMHSQILEEERQIFSEQANYLLTSLNELTAQQELTEAELKEEILARLNAEKKINEAEVSLKNIENILQETDDFASDCLINQLIPDVQVLRGFFKNVAAEAKMTADKPLIIKNSLLARKSYIQRAKSMRVELVRKEKSKINCLKLTEEKEDSSLRRSKSVLVNKNAQQKIKSLKRSMSTRATRLESQALGSLPE